MATTITFTDGIGAATLKNGKPVPGDRFANWTPRSVPVGDVANRQSDGAPTRFRVRDDHGATFELRGIPDRTTGGVRLVEIARRLVYHLLNGGTCSVNTGDVPGSVYATCGLMPGTEPSLTLSDPRTLEYTLSLSLINLAASPVGMGCDYDS